jgi:hypothetical protein
MTNNEIKYIDNNDNNELYLTINQQERQKKKKAGIKKAQDKFYKNHKALKIALAKEWTKANYETHLKSVRNYYIKHNARLSEKNILCCCGKMISKKSTFMHNGTKKHLLYIEQQNQQNAE